MSKKHTKHVSENSETGINPEQQPETSEQAPAFESVDIDGHRYGVETIDGKKYVLGTSINGVQSPDPAKLPEGYAVMQSASADLELSQSQGEQVLGEGEAPQS